MKRKLLILLLCVILLTSAVQAADVSLNAAEEQLLAEFILAEAEDAPYAVHLAIAAALLNRLTDARYPDTVSTVVSAAGYRAVRHTASYDLALSAVRTAAAGMDITNGATAWAREGTESAALIHRTFSAALWVFGVEG